MNRFHAQRRLSTVVHAGPVVIGGEHPLVVQSMCTTPTQDIAATVAQSIALAEHGCELVRITAPGVQDARALKDIRAQFSAAGYAHIPLCADIHFMPAAALEAIEHVEKVRINPGNYADKKSFAVIEYSDADYSYELERISERFTPLVTRAQELGRCLRIGVNHGSLSDRIMNRYGDSPQGMVESAMEFIHIAEASHFHNIVISMKSSNPKVMIYAYRLLCARLEEHGHAYPLHLGVTEAGDGDDGRIKGACGIGALLDDGIGDTIRVSLTEDPIAELPVARALCDLFTQRQLNIPDELSEINEHIDPLSYHRRNSDSVLINALPCGNHHQPLVLSSQQASEQSGFTADIISERQTSTTTHIFTRIAAGEHINSTDRYIMIDCDRNSAHGHPAISQALRTTLVSCTQPSLITIGSCSQIGPTRAYRLLHAIAEELHLQQQTPRHAICIHLTDTDLLATSSTCGSLFADGIGDAIYLPHLTQSVDMSFGILQAMKMRMSKTDYVACPSCGRTLFDLMEVSAQIKSLTDHLKGVTIAIMGCIVNGPGEMADADFGYVGSGPAKITLYQGQDPVLKNINTSDAPQKLVELIQKSGKWVERVES